jgi:GNAT superfamily N-acetyltransferase
VTVRRAWRRDGFVVDTDPERLDLPLVHRWLAEESYWARGVPVEVVRRAVAHSLNFGLYRAREQIGLARVVTDYATFAWLADVFVSALWRGRGLGVWLVETAMGCPELQGLRNVVLATADAHELYRRFGFTEPPPGRLMLKHDPDAYTRDRSR